MARPGQFDLPALLPALFYIVGDFGCLFGLLMKCHAVQVQLVLYTRSLKAAPMFCALPRLIFYYYSVSSASSTSSFRLPSAVCTVSEIDI